MSDFRVVRGQPTDGELAAIVMVLRAKLAAAAGEARPRSAWLHRESLLRLPVRPGPGAWRRSGLP